MAVLTLNRPEHRNAATFQGGIASFLERRLAKFTSRPSSADTARLATEFPARR